MILSIFNFPTPIYLLKHIWCRNSSDLLSVKVSLKKTSKNQHTFQASMPSAHIVDSSRRSRDGACADCFGRLTRLLVQDNWTYSHYLLHLQKQFVHRRSQPSENNEKLNLPLQTANLFCKDENYLYQTEGNTSVLMSNSVTPALGPIWDSYVDIAVKMYDADRFLPNSSYGMLDVELTGDLKVSGSGIFGDNKATFSFAKKTGDHSNKGTRIFAPTPFPSWHITSHMPLWTHFFAKGISHMPIFNPDAFVFETEFMWPVSQLVETGIFHINDYVIKLFKQHLASLNGSKPLVQIMSLPKVVSAPSVSIPTIRGSEAEGFLLLPLGLSPSKAQMRLHLNELRQSIRLARTSTQSTLIEKLTPWIRAWKDYYTFPDYLQLSPVIEGSVRFMTDSAFVGSTAYRLGFAKQANISLFKMLWRWACRRHPKKNRQWIKSKYFHSVKEKKGASYLTKKVIFSVYQASATYHCLPSHSLKWFGFFHIKLVQLQYQLRYPGQHAAPFFCQPNKRG